MTNQWWINKNMLIERKLTIKELERRESALRGLVKNKKSLVKRYGSNAERVMYGLATNQCRQNYKDMGIEKIQELVKDILQTPPSSPEEHPFHPESDLGNNEDLLSPLHLLVKDICDMSSELHSKLDTQSQLEDEPSPTWVYQSVVNSRNLLHQALTYFKEEENINNIDSQLP